MVRFWISGPPERDLKCDTRPLAAKSSFCRLFGAWQTGAQGWPGPFWVWPYCGVAAWYLPRR